MGLCKVVGILAVTAAVAIGCLMSGLVTKTGIFRLVDDYEFARGTIMMGMAPAFHEGKPWGLTEEEMPNLSGHLTIVVQTHTDVISLSHTHTNTRT